MQAGGPTRDAKVPAMRIERDADTFLQGDSLQLAFAHGLTVDQVGLRDGDRIVVPRMIVRDAESKWRVIGILVTIPVAVAQADRSEEHTSELQSLAYLVCRLLLEKKKSLLQ